MLFSNLKTPHEKAKEEVIKVIELQPLGLSCSVHPLPGI